jgi:hypothetical protein
MTRHRASAWAVRCARVWPGSIADEVLRPCRPSPLRLTSVLDRQQRARSAGAWPRTDISQLERFADGLVGR